MACEVGCIEEREGGGGGGGEEKERVSLIKASQFCHALTKGLHMNILNYLHVELARLYFN